MGLVTHRHHGLTSGDQSGRGRDRTVRATMNRQRPHPTPQAPADDAPAADALTQLLQSELARARANAPALVEQCDPGRVWLLWFAIGATEEICRLTQRRAEEERSQLFRHVVATIFDAGVRSPTSPSKAPAELVELFETAGVEAVQACMRGDARLGYYLEALKVAWTLTT
jgi:hypothetical protein